MRLFLATLLPSGDDAFYADVVGRMATALAPRVVRGVPHGTAHVTHAFLGDVDAGSVGAIEDVVRGVARHTAPLEVGLGRPELLGGGRGPRAILVPVADGRQALFDWQVDLTLALRRVPVLATLPMPKPPHVTIARFSRSATRRDADRVREALATLSAQDRPLRIARVQLMHSTLTSSGPRYEELAGFDFRAGAAI